MDCLIYFDVGYDEVLSPKPVDQLSPRDNMNFRHLILWTILSAFGVVIAILAGYLSKYLSELSAELERLRINVTEERQSRLRLTQSIQFFETSASIGQTAVARSGDSNGEFVMPPEDKCGQDSARDTEGEALSSLSLALDFQALGKPEKAKKLLSHALALQPNHPDVLVHYGLYMENVHDDVVKAEQYYTRALIFSPGHDLAIQSRRRTQPLVEEIDNQMLKIIDLKREYFVHLPRENGALKRAKRESYFNHVYHTVALEGNTMSLIETRVILETRVAIAGKSILEHNEILGMDEALRFLNKSLSETRIGTITLQEILDLHLRVLGFVDPVEAGRFRTTQVYVGKFVPIGPEHVQREMEDFVAWLNLDSTLNLHPVEMASLAHYRFVYIHPFVDGNGRTARLIMNWILMQAGFPPVIIRVEDRLEYYETLRLANEGDLRPFIRFIAQATGRTLNEYLYSVLEDAGTLIPELESQSAAGAKNAKSERSNNVSQESSSRNHHGEFPFYASNGRTSQNYSENILKSSRTIILENAAATAA